MRVTGDSLVDVGIKSGTLVIFNTKQTPHTHNEIIANHNGTIIIKRYEADENGNFTLYSENGGK